MITQTNLVYGTSLDFYLSEMPNTFKACKKPIPIKYCIADKDQLIETPEGRVQCFAGDAIMNREDGGQWPISKKKFEATYLPNPNTGTAVKKNIVVSVQQMPEPFFVQLNWGDRNTIQGDKGDYLVEYAKGDFGIVTADEFLKTYERIPAAS